MADTSNALSHVSIFERIKRTTEEGFEYWQSRELGAIFQYTDYRNFEGVIDRAKLACINSGQSVEDHFGDATEMIDIGKGGQREIPVVLLSRYACYLIIQSADEDKETVALGKTYFAIQTRRQELNDQATEDERRVLLREELKVHNAQLAEAASACGVIAPVDYAIFQNHGYMGLYGGKTAQDIHAHKRLKKNQKILDHMGSAELAANLFRATQAEEKLRRDKPVGKNAANQVHRDVGAKVRKTIKELGGTMPEDLPVVENINAVAKRLPQKKDALPAPSDAKPN